MAAANDGYEPIADVLNRRVHTMLGAPSYSLGSKMKIAAKQSVSPIFPPPM